VKLSESLVKTGLSIEYARYTLVPRYLKFVREQLRNLLKTGNAIMNSAKA
jgi:hypothetical protein